MEMKDEEDIEILMKEKGEKLIELIIININEHPSNIFVFFFKDLNKSLKMCNLKETSHTTWTLNLLYES